MRSVQRRFERVLEYFVQGDLDVKMKRMSVAIWILIVVGAAAMFWAANLKISVSPAGVPAVMEKIAVWRVLFNKR
ncbi:MAG: hypothetical protein HYW49_12900 [Deltaproteobacteria bacterium]|nr:hypothetical protein [Deltaproteobacteria bacterium]